MKKLLLLTLVAAPIIGVSGPATAQESAPPVMYWVYQEFVKPPMLQEYEAAAKEMIDVMGSVAASGSVEYVTISGSQFDYAYVLPIEGFAGIDKIWQEWTVMVEAIGQEKWAEIEARSSKTIDHAQASVLMLREDLSYHLEMTALTTDRPFRAYTYWYAIPGKTYEIEGVAKEYIDLFEAKGVEHGWRIYEIVMGPDQPVYLQVETAADEAAYHANAKDIREALGEEGVKLNMKALKYSRRVEEQHGWIRPDLSFPPPTEGETRD